MHILLTISYDGTDYAGWQRQKNAVAVQEKLEEALESITQAASRTDAGVHALGQRVSFRVPDGPAGQRLLKIPLEKLPRVINSLLPADIVVREAVLVPENFNPRFDAVSKTYRYQIYNAPVPNPLLARYSAYVPQRFSEALFSETSIKKMQAAAAFIVGRHDFAAFCAAGGSAKTTVRTVFDCAVESEADLITLTITGDGFLYNMVRIIAGTLVYVGMGKILPEEILAIISSRDRTRAGKTMPPQGLTLMEVRYEKLQNHSPKAKISDT